jgi:uncharacterized repeat protein (TIGR02543 family)
MKIFFFNFLLCLVIYPTFAQDFLKIDPVDPTAASMAKYGDFPVNYSKGLPNITIPIYQIKSGNLTQDITLSYHGGGIKVSEDASWVGLGWDLFYGGTITREVYGKPDENEDLENIPNARNIYDAMNGKPYESNGTYNQWADGEITYMQDIYYFNISNYSGKFVLDNTKKPMQIPYSPLKITDDFQTIYTPDGVKYEFNATRTDLTTISHHSAGGGMPSHPTTWHIGKISSPNSNDFIEYEYQDDGYITSLSMDYSQGFKVTYGYCDNYETFYSSLPFTESVSQIQVKSVKPKYIYFSGGRLVFNLSSRNDIYYDQSFSNNRKEIKKLDNIEVQRKEPDGYSTIKTIKFYYSYFISASPYNDSRFGTTHSDCLKLKLDRVDVIGNDDIQLIAEFDYYEEYPIAKKKSYATDFWGFYNGKSNSSPILKQSISVGYQQEIIGGAIKNPVESYTKTANLKSITYPTEGKTEFQWEMNTFGGDKPYNIKIREMKDVGIISYNSTDLDCNIEPDPDSDIDYDLSRTMATISPKIDQTIRVSYYLYQSHRYNNQQSNQHDKYDKGYFKLTDVTSNKSSTFGDMHTDRTDYYKDITLAAGHTYCFSVYNNCYNVQAGLSFSYNTYDPDKDKYNYPIGGLRIKKIINYDNNNKILGQKAFTYKVPRSTNSSGYLTNRQNQSYDIVSHNVHSEGCYNEVTKQFEGCANVETSITTFHSNPITGISPSYLTYQYVQEFDLDERGISLGYTEHEFNICEDAFIGTGFPIFSNEWRRGQLVRQTIYDNSSPAKKVKEIVNNYSIDSRINKLATGFKMNKYFNLESFCALNAKYKMGEVYGAHNYSFTSQWYRIDNTTTNDYFKNGDSLSTTIVYEYNNLDNCLPSLEKISLNNNITKIIKNKYPTDYSTGILGSMKNLHMISPVIERQEWLDNGQKTLNAGILYEYNPDTYGHTVLDKIHVLELKEPISQINEGFSNNKYLILKPTANNAEYVEKVNYNYNQDGRLIEELKTDNQYKSIIWGYESTLPIATIIGTDFNTAQLKLGGEAGISGLQNITGDTELQNALASLYTIPNSLVTTYTYLPLVGITSKTDPNGKSTYYNYDGLGRMTEIKDNQKSKLKSYNYHYAGKPIESFVNYTISTTTNAGGTISPVNPVIENGKSVTINIRPNVNYHIKDVKVNGVSKGAVSSYEFTNLTGGQSINAVFEINNYIITATNAGSGTMLPSGNSTVNYGADLSYTLKPSTNYHIKDVKVDGVSVGAVSSYTFSNVTSGHTLYVEFEINSYTISFDTKGGSSITDVTANYNSLISAPDSPTKTGYTFGGWFKETSCTNVWNFSTDFVTANTTLYAKWTINRYTVFFVSGESTVNSVTARYNTTISAPIPPTKTCCTFGGWFKEESTIAWNFDVDVITSNTIINAKWIPKSYTITATKTGNGNITPSGNSILEFDDAITYTFTPLTNYYIKDVKVDGASVGAVSSYTFSHPTSNHTLLVEFGIKLSVNTTNIPFLLTGGTSTFVISSSTSWTITKPSWISLSATSGSGSKTITVNCPLSKSTRDGSITITGGGVTHIINVSQTLYSPE